jgi:hypothetical protein
MERDETGSEQRVQMEIENELEFGTEYKCSEINFYRNTTYKSTGSPDDCESLHSLAYFNLVGSDRIADLTNQCYYCEMMLNCKYIKV